jgi:hypothetical protein
LFYRQHAAAMAYDDFEFLLIELGEFGGAAASSDPSRLNFLHHLCDEVGSSPFFLQRCFKKSRGVRHPNSSAHVRRVCGTFPFADHFPHLYWRNKMSNLDNQPGRDNRAGFDNRTPDQRTGLDSSAGIGTGTITAIIAAVVIAGALMLFGPWGTNRSAINNSTPTSSNSTPGTTTGQTPSGAPRVIAPAVAPAAPTTTAPAPNPQ